MKKIDLNNDENYKNFLKMIHICQLSKDWYYAVNAMNTVFCFDNCKINHIFFNGKIKETLQHKNVKEIRKILKKMNIDVTILYDHGKWIDLEHSIQLHGVEQVYDFLINYKKYINLCKECGFMYCNLPENCAYKSRNEEVEFVDTDGNKLKNENLCSKCTPYSLIHFLQESSKICSICQEPSFRFHLDCGHCFHLGCLTKLSSNNLKCPNCRAEIPMSFFNQFLPPHKLLLQEECYSESDSTSEISI